MLYRLFSQLKHYTGYLLLNIISNIGYVFFSLFSLSMMAPFLSVLFGLTERVDTLPEHPAFNTDTFLHYAYYYIGRIQDSQGDFMALVSVALIFLTFTVLANIARYLGMFFLGPIRGGMIRELRSALYARIIHLPLAVFSKQRKGDLIARMTSDVNEVEWALIAAAQNLLKDPIYVLVSLAALFSISATMTFLVLLVMPLMIWLVAFIGKRLKRQSHQSQSMVGELLNLSEEAISGVRVIKSFNLIDYTIQVFQRKNRQYTVTANSVHRRNDLADPLTEILLIAIAVVVLWFGGVQVLKGAFSPDKMFLFILLFVKLISPAKKTVAAIYRLQKGAAALERVYEVVDEPEQVRERPDAQAKRTFEQDIRYENVAFSYPDGPSDESVLHGIDLRIEKGRTYAFVGASGSGKTTTADLLPRFYDVTGGRILLDGIDLRDLRLTDLRQLIGTVSQIPFVWNDTVENNIRFGGDYTAEEVVAAAKKANAHDFICAMPEGYQSPVGDRGCNLSGGQRQRLVIARAILKNAPILILDEATSALDTESEQAVQAALTELMLGRTSIVIAHRLSTIRHADRIFVFDDGRIVEEGPHEELMRQNGAYAQLVRLQNLT